MAFITRRRNPAFVWFGGRPADRDRKLARHLPPSRSVRREPSGGTTGTAALRLARARTAWHRQRGAHALRLIDNRPRAHWPSLALAPTTENHPCSVLCRWLCAPHEHNYTATAPASASRAVCVARNTEWDARSPCLLPRATDDGDHSALGRHGTRCYASSDARMTPTALDACASCYYCLSHCYGGRANHLCDLS